MTAEAASSKAERLREPEVTDDQRSLALITHLTLLGHIVVPVAAIVAPIVIWQVQRKASPFMDDHGREAVNFQISMMIYSVILPVIAGVIGALTCGVGLVLLIPAVLLPYVLGCIGMILASMAANRGEYYRYPMNIRLIPG